MRKLLVLGFLCLPILATASGMAVSLSDLYIQNATRHSQIITIRNLPESENQFKLLANSICRIKPAIMFQPFTEESNSFVLMLESHSTRDPIVIDKNGNLTLAHAAINSFNYSGEVDAYRLFGFCGGRLRQSGSLMVVPQTNPESAPNFILANCSKVSTFIYTLSERKKYKLKRTMRFDKIKDCLTIRQERIQNTAL